MGLQEGTDSGFGEGAADHTHYAHVYVGTPAQRVSVIVDTGSHHTAFPCSGCKSCGKHTDPYFAARNDGSWFRPNRARNAHRTLIPS